jgi:predicted transcriptional regulator
MSKGIVRSSEEINGLLAAYQTSGLAPGTFARQSNISSSTFYQWLHKPKRQTPVVRLAQVIRSPKPSPISEGESRAKLCVEIADTRIFVADGFRPQTFADVVRILRETTS